MIAMDLRRSRSLDGKTQHQQQSSSDSDDDYSDTSNNWTDDFGEFQSIGKKDLIRKGLLGFGCFGKVDLVQLAHDQSRSFALKYIKKTHLVKNKQEKNIFAEKDILMNARCPFIVRLYKTFRDDRYLYMLLEVCLGGELWTILRDSVSTVSVISMSVPLPTCQPENIVLDSQGYLKLVDFGFAKRIGFGCTTKSLCGTPQYMAPEIILGKGHDTSVDSWALGVLLYEILSGCDLFSGSTKQETYKLIIKGISAAEFSKVVSKCAADLIYKLCKYNPLKRWGCLRDSKTDVRNHRWFDGFHWDALRSRRLVSPIVPKVEGPTDLSNFDPCTPPESNEVLAVDSSGWDKDFGPLSVGSFSDG